MAKHGLMPWELHLLQQFASIGIMIWVSESLSHIAHRGFLKFANALIHDLSAQNQFKPHQQKQVSLQHTVTMSCMGLTPIFMKIGPFTTFGRPSLSAKLP